MPFNYFGRKSRIAHLYPRPHHDTIIEPFAGSAGYALHADNWTNQVILIEAHPEIAALWRWLINPTTTPETILELPDMPPRTNTGRGPALEDLGFGPKGSPIRTLASLTSPSSDFHKNYVTEWMQKGWANHRARVAANLHKIKHWTLIEGDYTESPTIEATWFIDPPYQKIEHGYDSDRQTIDFKSLAEWALTRPGQLIVAEESGADWLPFKPLTLKQTINGTDTTEVIYTNTIDNLLDYAGLE